MSPKSDRAVHTAAAGSIKPDRHFLPDYYAHVPTEEVQNYSTETLRARAVHLSVASSRRPGQAAVGILNELEASIVAVVTEDLPYLVQSVMAELTREDASIRLLVHPTFQVLRDPDSHTLLDVRPGPSREGLLEESVPPARGTSETWVAMEIGKLADEAAESELTERLQRVLDDVRIVAEDAAAIHGKVSEADSLRLLFRHRNSSTSCSFGSTTATFCSSGTSNMNLRRLAARSCFLSGKVPRWVC